MILQARLLFVLYAFLCTSSSWVHSRSNTPFLWVHNHLLTGSKTGILKGDYADFGLSGESLALGSLLLPFPVKLPGDRGEILHNPLPLYSHQGGLSEWGKGWSSAMSIHRYAEIGEADCKGNLFSSPWGKLQPGSTGQNYHSKGMELDLRATKTSSGFIVYHPSGPVFRFEKAHKDLAWYLTEVKDREGHRTVLEYEDSAIGRPFLKTVRYGGKKRFQYEIEIQYEKIKIPIRSYESCQVETSLDRMVRRIDIKNWDGQQFQVVRKINLTHDNLYLSKIETDFVFGEKKPPITYYYDGYKQFSEQPYHLEQNNFFKLVERKRANQFFRDNVTFVDINLDGLMDIEQAEDLKSFLQTKEGHFVPYIDFGTSNRDKLCPPYRNYYENKRRLLIRPAGLKDSLQQLVFLDDIDQNKIIFCSLDGKVQYEKSIPREGQASFSFKEDIHLVDLNGDLKPDLVRLMEGYYTYFLNESTENEIRFSDPVTKSFKLVPKETIIEIYFVDMNGDCLVDIVAKRENGIVIWYGKGQLNFGPEAVYRDFYNTFGLGFMTIKNFELGFVDINRDGLMDVLLSGYMAINSGDRFYFEPWKSFENCLRHAKHPGVINLSGTVDDQVNLIAHPEGLIVYTLNGPSTGLLTRVDNGQGVVLDFEYQWTDFKPGVPKPFIVPKSLTVRTAGKGVKKTEFEFIDPQVNLAMGGQLLGFAKINTKDAGVLTQTDYITSTEHPPKVRETRKQDVRVSGLIEFEHHDWEPASLEGLPYIKLSKSTQAYVTDTETILRRSVDYLNHDRLCMSQTREITPVGILEKLVSYFDSRACLKSNERLVGSDFVYTTLTDYNQAGLVTNSQLATSTEKLQKTALGYDKEFNLKNVTQPSTGTVFLHYDPVFEILKLLQFPDGTWREMTGYSPEADAASGMRLKGSGKTALEQTYLYDAFHRLKQTSNNLGEQYDYSYRLPNQTAPGLLLEASTQTVILSSADGEKLTLAKQSQTGWYFEKLHRVIPAEHKEQQVDLSHLHQNPAEIAYQDLEAASQILDETESSELGGILSRQFAVDSTHTNYLTRSFDVDSLGFKANSRENNQYHTQSVADLSHGQPISYTDELGQTYTYRRDVLGRLREITLLDGNTHKIDFDNFGRVKHVSRSNIGNVSYVYDNEHDRLKEKTVLGQREFYEYDLAGQIDIKTYEKERYKFSYEGSAITEVRHAEFTKKFLYTPDDKPELKSLKTKTGLSVDIEFKYNKFRYLEEQKVSNVYTKQFIYDDYRQLGLVKIGSQTFSVKRDDLGKISRIILPNNQTFYVDYDSLTQGRLGHSSDLGSYYWGFNDRGLITNTGFTSSSDVCDQKALGFVYAPDKTLQEPAFAKATAGTSSSRGLGIYDEHRHRIGTYKNGCLDSIRFEDIVRTAIHIYEKFSIEGIDLGILTDGQFQPCLFDQVGSLIAIGEIVSIPSVFGERADYLPIFEYFDYAGHGRDPETGLIAMGERDYDPRTHQFTSPDKHFLENPEECIRSPQECNLYSYAKNNPLLYIDEDGQMAKIIAAGFVALGRAALPYVSVATKNIIRENVQTAVRDLISSPTDERGLISRLKEQAGAKEWQITNPEKVIYHPRFKTFLKDGNSYTQKEGPYWWAKDLSGHGESVWKVFTQTAKGLEWKANADKFGDFIPTNKGDVGRLIPWRGFKNVK